MMQNTEIKLDEFIALVCAQPQSNQTETRKKFPMYQLALIWGRMRERITTQLIRDLGLLLLQQSDKLGSVSLHLKQNGVILVEKLFHCFQLYRNPRNTRNKGTGSDTNKTSSHLTKGDLKKKKKQRERKYNFGTRKNLICHHKDKLLHMKKKKGQKIKQVNKCTASSILYLC